MYSNAPVITCLPNASGYTQLPATSIIKLGFIIPSSYDKSSVPVCAATTVRICVGNSRPCVFFFYRLHLSLQGSDGFYFMVENTLIITPKYNPNTALCKTHSLAILLIFLPCAVRCRFCAGGVQLHHPREHLLIGVPRQQQQFQCSNRMLLQCWFQRRDHDVLKQPLLQW